MKNDHDGGHGPSGSTVIARIERHVPATGPADARLILPFEARCRSRLRTRLDTGEEVGVMLERGTVLRHGDHVLMSDGRVVEVVAAPEPLYEARSSDAVLLARAAFHLGNRHITVAIGAGILRFARDHVLAEMVQGLGLEVQEVLGPFEPEGGAYGGHSGHAYPHGHSADGEGYGPRIHEMGKARDRHDARVPGAES